MPCPSVGFIQLLCETPFKVQPKPNHLYNFGYRQRCYAQLIVFFMQELNHDLAESMRPHLAAAFEQVYKYIRPAYTPLMMYRIKTDFAKACGLSMLNSLEMDLFADTLIDNFRIYCDNDARTRTHLGHPSLTVHTDHLGQQLSRVDYRNHRRDPSTWDIKRQKRGGYKSVGTRTEIYKVRGNGQFATVLCDRIKHALQLYSAFIDDFPMLTELAGLRRVQ